MSDLFLHLIEDKLVIIVFSGSVENILQIKGWLQETGIKFSDSEGRATHLLDADMLVPEGRSAFLVSFGLE